MGKALVTGSAGLIGSHVVRELLKLGHEVVSIDNLSGGLPENVVVDEKHLFFENDLNNHEKVSDIFECENPDVVFNIAAVATEGASHFRKRYIYQQNLMIAVNVINCCVNYGVEKLLHTSSMATYGGWKEPPFDETDETIPEDTYGNAKVAIENEIKISHEFFGKPEYIIIRPHNCIGVGQNIFDRYRNVIGIFIRQGLLKQPITVFGDGLQKRAFSNIRDTAPAIVRAMFSDECNGEVINVGGTIPYTILEAAKVVQSHFSESPIQHLQERFEVKNAWCTYEKSQRLLGYKDTVSLGDGIAEMIEWAKSLPMREVQSWDSYEIDKKLYSFWK